MKSPCLHAYPAASRTGFVPCKINAPSLGDHHLGLIKILLPAFFIEKPPAARPPQISRIKYINPQFVKIPYACACARACAAVCALGRAREALPQKFPPQSTRKNGAVPPGSAGQKQENKNFSKKFAQTGRNLPPRLRIILVEGFATRKRPPIPPKFAFCTEMTHQGETI